MTAFQVLSSAAVAFVVARAGIFAWLRRGRPGWVTFITCPLCVGFWVGAGIYTIRWAFRPELRPELALDAVAGGALVGAVALLFTSVIDWLDALERAANRTERPDQAPSDARLPWAPTAGDAWKDPLPPPRSPAEP